MAGRRLWGILPYLIIVLFAFVMFYSIFNDGFLVSLDNPIHLAESYSSIENLKATGWVSGWSMDAYVGYPLQLFPRYQLGLWLIALLNLVFSVPVELAYKTILFVSYLFPALVIFFVGKKLFNKILPALVPSILFLLIRRDVVVTALTGQWNSLLALGFLAIFIYLTHRFFIKPSLRSSIWLSVVFALIILSHPFAAFVAVLFFSVYFVVFWVKRSFSVKRFGYGVFIFFVGALLCAFYILPALDMRGWLDTSIGWPLTYNALALPYKVLAPFVFAVPKGVVTSELFSALSSNIFLFLKLVWLYFIASLPQLFIFVFGVIGLFYLFEGWRKDDSTTMLLISIFFFMLLCLIIGSGFWFLVPSIKNLPLFSNFQSYRFLVYVNFSLLLFVSYALSNLRNDVYPQRLRFLYSLLDKRKIIFVLLVLFFVANLNDYIPDRSETLTVNDPAIRNDFFPLADWVSANVDGSSTRIIYQDFYGNIDYPLFDSSHIPAMFYHYTHVNSVGGWYPSSSYPTDKLAFTSSGTFLGNSMDEVTPGFVAGRMILINAKYVVSTNDNLEKVLASSGMFKKELSGRIFNVFSLKDYNPEWISYSGNFSYNMVSFDKDVVLFNYNITTDKTVFVKVSYHPYWHAYVDDNEIYVSRSRNNLVSLDLPQGSHSVLLSYQPFKWSYLMLTLITILFLFMLSFLLD